MDIKIKIIEIVSRVAASKNIDFLLIGAYARNLFLAGKKDIPTPSYTYDIDVAFQVENWNEYEILIKSLLDSDFKHDLSNKHRLLFGSTNIPLDIIPFGKIEDSQGKISWPPDFDVSMNVRGFQTALTSADIMSIGKTSVKVITPPLFALLKLASYLADNSRTKDIKDFYFIASHYFEIIDADSRVYNSGSPDEDILDKTDFDYTVAGAELIGRDCVAINRKLSEEISILLRQANTNLVIAFAKYCNEKPDNAQKIINGLFDGIMH